MTDQANAPPKLEARNISKLFTSRRGELKALDDVSLHLEDGGFLTLIGHSGCGKSTLLNIIAGLEEATSGTVFIDGIPRSDPGPDRGMVFQSYTLFPWHTVVGNVEFGTRMKELSKAERRETAMEYLEIVQLTEFAHSYPKELSGGMKQRVALARALANKPEVLLMDEPFGALDAETRETMQNLLLQIREKERITVLFITHDVDEAILLAERIGVMSTRPGRVKHEVPIDLAYPRNADMKLSGEFIEIKRRVVELFKQV